LLSATGADGVSAFAGRRVTTFTDEEELQGGTGANSPYFVETELRKLGVAVEVAAPWSSHVVVDRNLVSGQNPQSSVDTARQVLETLGAAK
jgi:putative intracellular protease/amidase